ncbi:MAG TPA: bifunctional UDP-sugar hydrolase/5'-nucleotidase, partial [Polyangiaceae bacterium]|nr:bifunctional UDP-sugar hydrolase/5'-nucleotidase [Polyangiaceae bacterium]
MMRGLVWIWGCASWLLACEAPAGSGPRETGPTTLVLIHTADLHSHLFPERQMIDRVDAGRGLGRAGELSEVGGFARLASAIGEIRAGARHSLYLDSGDLVEGTAAFNEFGGEPELRASSALGLNAAALGNHDLSAGAEAFARLHREFADFPVLACNFADNGSELSSALNPSAVLDAQGVRVGVIGVANPSSPSGLTRADNPYGIELLPTASAVQSEIDRLRPQVDVLVALSHLGLDGDQRLISGTTGLDVVLGGHQHLALDAALDRTDCAAPLQAERGCTPRRVVLVHSGALGRYVGELDLELVPDADGAVHGPNSFVVATAEHSLIPVTAEISEEPQLAALLEPYRARLEAAGYDTPLAFASDTIERYAADGADSALGDLVADAIRSRSGADFALLNSTGIRADLPRGELTRAAFVAALPFDDALSVLTLSGAQLRTLFNQQARVASDRDCQTPIQISGLSLAFKCSGAASSAVARSVSSGRELAATEAYSLVTSAYLADGARGFEVLTDASARQALELDALGVVLDSLAAWAPCGGSTLPCLEPTQLRDHRIT